MTLLIKPPLETSFSNEIMMTGEIEVSENNEKYKISLLIEITHRSLKQVKIKF